MFDKIVFYSPKPAFSQGHTNVAASRVTLRKGLKILSIDETDVPSIDTRNTPYLEDTLQILAQTYYYSKHQ
jgi:hypothetical protein